MHVYSSMVQTATDYWGLPSFTVLDIALYRNNYLHLYNGFLLHVIWNQNLVLLSVLFDKIELNVFRIREYCDLGIVV